METRRDVIGSLLLYDYWFLLVGLMRGLPLQANLTGIEFIAFLILPYLTYVVGIGLEVLSLFSGIIFGFYFRQEVPPLLTLTNLVLRLHMSGYAFFSTVIASAMARKPTQAIPFVQNGGLIWIYCGLLFWGLLAGSNAAP